MTLCDGLPVDLNNKMSPAIDKVDFTEDENLSSKLQIEPSENNSLEAEDDEACVDENDLENEEKEVYIQNIADDSLAAADGRLCRGDIILQVSFKLLKIHFAYLFSKHLMSLNQINGVDVRNRYQAETLFASAGSEITLLVSRPHNQVSHFSYFTKRLQPTAI